MTDFSVVERHETTLVNIKDAPEEAWDVYIGRGNSHYGVSDSRFANPFTLDDFSRQEAVNLYKLWFYHRVRTCNEFANAARDLHGKTLACWCVPQTCHGEVILQWLDRQEVPEDEVRALCALLRPKSVKTGDETVDAALREVARWVDTDLSD